MKLDSMKTKRGDVHLDLNVNARPEDSAEAGDAIDIRRLELDQLVAIASQAHDAAAAATDVATGTAQRMQAAIARLSLELAAVSRQHSELRESGIEQVLAGLAANGEVVVAELLESEALAGRYRVVSETITLLAETRLPEAEEKVLEATIAETLSKADRINAVADRRQIETELLLVAIAAEEGDAVLDDSKTLTGVLRAEADSLVLSVVPMRDELLRRQRLRVAVAEQQLARSIGRRL